MMITLFILTPGAFYIAQSGQTTTLADRGMYVVSFRPEHVAKKKGSYTGKFLKKVPG